MSVIHKMIEYAICELDTAEKYIKLAKKIEEPSISIKLQEIAKDELRHCEFFQTHAIKIIEKNKKEIENSKEGDVEDSIENTFFDVYENWKDKVTYMVDTFEIKK